MIVAIGLMAAACTASSDVSSPSESTASEGEVATTLDVTDAASTEPPDDPTGPTIGGTLIVGNVSGLALEGDPLRISSLHVRGRRAP